MKLGKFRIEGTGPILKNYRVYLNDDDITMYTRGFTLEMGIDRANVLNISMYVDVGVAIEDVAILQVKNDA